MGQKHFSNFVFPSKCRGSNTFLHPNNLPLLVDTPDLHKIHQVDICFKEIPSYRHQPDVKELTFLTYNIWFQMQNEHNRIPCIVKLLETSNADFICLQEVTHSFVQQLQKQKWIQQYSVSGFAMHNYDCLILSKFNCKFKRIPYPNTGMGRSLLIAETLINDRLISVATSHFESLNSTPLRVEQLLTAFKSLQGDDALLMGDFNFDSRYGSEEKSIPQEWKDLYLEVHNREDATMPASVTYPEWRIDRILLKSKNYEVVQIERIGNFTIPPFEEDSYEKVNDDGVVRTPSDHFGLAAVIRLNSK